MKDFSVKSITQIPHLSEETVQGRTVIPSLPKESIWFKMLIRLSLVKNSYVMEKIFAFSESGRQFNRKSVFIYLYDFPKDFSKTFKTMAQNYR